MKYCLLLSFLASILLPSTVFSQEQTEQPIRDLELNVMMSDSIEGDVSHEYLLSLDANQFVAGVANQISVDLVVTVYDPDDQIVRTFDNPARGPESFQFDAEAPGGYRIEIKPFEQQEGEYTLLVERIEPIAEAPEARVDQLLAFFDNSDVPGAVVGVVKDGYLAFSKAYGMADLSHSIPFTTETLTNIGSTSKQFTAFAIALLADQGQLSIDDDVRKYIPELPDFGETVTLRHMMTHTTGYREFLNTIALTGRQLGEGEFIDRDELIEIVQRQPALQNDPGAEWNYNNTSFGLLTIVVERVTGQSFPDWMRENVFEPLGMEHTLVRKNQSQIVPNRSTGYLTDREGAYREAADLGGAMGAGAIYTTPGDLALWMSNYHDPKVGSAKLIEAMTTPFILTTGDTTNYGFGLFIDEQRGLKRYQHGGADIAHRSMFMYFPEINSGVVALSNFGSFSNPAGEIAEVFFGDHMTQEKPVTLTQNEDTPFDPDNYDPEDFDALAGRYALEIAPTFILTLTREEDKLYVQATNQPKLEILPTSDSTFKLTAVEASLTFHRNADEEVKTLTLHQNGDQKANRLEEEPWEPSEEEQKSYEGRYFSEELETLYHVTATDSGLVLTQRRLNDIKLTPTKKDVFGASFPVAELSFIRNEEGEVEGFKVSNVRTRGVRFDKQ